MTRKKTGLIYAFDQSGFTHDTIVQLASLATYVDYFKVGLEAMTAIDGRSGKSVAQEVIETVGRKSVMYDIKLLDVKNTMAKAAANIATFAPLFTLHAQAADESLEAIAEICRARQTLALAVTVLTDLDDDLCTPRFSCTSSHAVTRFARLAYAKGIRGFVCSPKEIALIRDALGSDVTIVTPGIRPAWYVTPDEQKRVATPTQAAQAGADYVVVGRPIRSEKDARRIREELDGA